MNADWALAEGQLNSQLAGSLIGAIILCAGCCSVGLPVFFAMLFAFPVGTIASCALGFGMFKVIKSLVENCSRITRCKKYIEIIKNNCDNKLAIDALCQYTNTAKMTVHGDLKWFRNLQTIKHMPLDINLKTGLITMNDYQYNTTDVYPPNEPKGNIPAAPKKTQAVVNNEAETIFTFREGDMQYEANRFLQHLAIQKERCQDKEISELIVQLRVGIGKLLSYGYQNPHDCEEIRSFNRKYLITCIKLLDKFIEIEQLVKDSTIHHETRVQLVNGLQNLVAAYNVNLENMYNDDVVDINSDISVIESMLAQEGLLTDNDLVLDMSKLNENQNK